MSDETRAIVARLRDMRRLGPNLNLRCDAADEIERLDALTGWRPIEEAPVGEPVVLLDVRTNVYDIAVRREGHYWPPVTALPYATHYHPLAPPTPA